MNNGYSFKKFSYISIGRIIATGLQAIFYLIFAALLGTEQYGQMSYLIAIAGTFSVIFRFGLPHTISVYQAKKDLITSNQVNTLAIITTSIGAIILLFIDPFAAILSLSISFLLMNLYNLLGLKNYKKHAIIDIIKSILVIILPISLFFVIDMPGILLGIMIGNFLCSVQFLKKISFKVQSFNKIRKNFKVIIHNYGADISSNLPRVADKLLIAPLFGFSLVGIYQFNLQILFALEILPIMLHGFLLSEESSGKSIHWKFILAIIGIAGLLVFAVIIISPIFVSELFPQFQEGVFSLQILSFSLFPLVTSAIFSAKLQAKESTRVGYSAIVRIVSLLSLIVILGESYGLVGLSIAVLISSTMYAVFLVILNYKMQKQR
jgi:O-antigen/teichoic acid export membrane protein